MFRAQEASVCALQHIGDPTFDDQSHAFGTATQVETREHGNDVAAENKGPHLLGCESCCQDRAPWFVHFVLYNGLDIMMITYVRRQEV